MWEQVLLPHKSLNAPKKLTFASKRQKPTVQPISRHARPGHHTGKDPLLNVSEQGLPLLSLGLMWFFASHALSSNVVPLEQVFEHRNYFAVLGIVLAIAIAPLSWWAATKLHDRAVFLRETPAVVAALRQDLPPGATLMARTYNPAGMLAFHHGAYVPVFGPGRHHARQDDQIIDFRRYDGQPIRVFLYDEPARADFEPYFDSLDIKRLTLRGVDFWVVDGQGFRFQPFRDQVLAQVAREFHDIPAWLPVLGNPFCERYGFADCAPGRAAGR